MNGRIFDGAGGVRGTGSRRTALRILADGAIVALIAGFGRGDAAAKRKKCPSGRKRCGKRCCKQGQLCAGGRCVTGIGTCAVGADTCVVPFTSCDGTQECGCFRTTAGATRCGHTAEEAQCGECATDADCEATHGKGAFCIDLHAPACSCGPAGPVPVCGVPCEV